MIKLHKPGEDNAKELIGHGKVSHKPFTFDAADRDELLGAKGTDVRAFALHHLGEDDQAEEGTPKRYRYAFAKAGMVHSRALGSIRDRARENGHDEIRASAEGLIRLIEDAGGDADHDASTGGEGPVESKSLRPGPERRCLMAGLELRAAPQGSDSPGTIVGYAAVFDRFSQDLGHFRERIEPGAFAGCAGQDVRALVNHDPSLLIGRTKAGTCRMREDPLGLRAEIDLPDTQLGRDTATSIRRGDMDGMSFSFAIEPGSDEWDWKSEPPTRTLRSIKDLYDVSAVTYPAYVDTTAAMRSLNDRSPRQAGAVDAPAPPPIERPWARQRLAEATLIP